ncbi:type 1 glutamine amidotransferase family protein [Vagococcus carniphilus]|uniref:type 1 glutamine amidotransferase family protein n=1 Tax=Vagococcus carniphilus TaxID=218144 RepID=UPI003B598B88
MKTAIFFLLDDYADWEGAYLSSTLNKKEDWIVKTASIQREVTSIGGFTTKIDFLMDELPKQIDLFIMVGGNSWGIENKSLFTLVKNYLEGEVTVGSICGAVDYLARNGFLNDHKHTGNSLYLWESFENYTNGANFMEKQAVRDQQLVTANGTAPNEFTKLILEAIEFDGTEAIEKTMYMNQYGFYNYCEKYGNPFF